MPKISDIITKRRFLSSVRLRFSPHIQVAREAAIDGIIENILFAVENSSYITLEDLAKSLSKNLKAYISNNVIHESLDRLVDKSRVEYCPQAPEGVKVKGKKKFKEYYRLDSSAKTELAKIDEQATNRFNRVCERLFKNTDEGWTAYAEPFLKFLTSIFTKLADENVRMIRGDLIPDQLISSQAFSSALNFIKKDIKHLNIEVFESGITTFFREPYPDYAEIKWDMSQNYYVLRVLGVDNESLLVSSTLFEDAILYLDTNVVISALEPKESHHTAFLALTGACKNLGINVKVCRVTLDELERVLAANYEMIQKTVNQIPNETKVKIASDFFEIYYEKEESGGSLDFEEVFANYISAGDKLKQLYGVEVEDDEWFSQILQDDRMKKYANVIAKRYAQMRTRPKNEHAAIHDSLCLLWVEKLRGHNPNLWFVTRDYTLPGCIPDTCQHRSLAITLDALLQWLSPVAFTADEQKDIALAYSEIISARVLPQERIFSLEDFVIFSELNMECKGLPPEDVEGCVRYIKQNAALLNPADPVDREKLAHAISVYFADPSRKYKQNLAKYEKRIAKLTGELKRRRGTSLKTEAKLRLSHIFLLFILLESFVVIPSAIFGEGDNVLQKIVNSWPFVLIPIPLCAIAGWFYIGRKRIETLDLPFKKFFKGR